MKKIKIKTNTHRIFSYGIILFTLIVTCLLFFFETSFPKTEEWPANKAVLDLNNRYFNSQGPLSLTGDWEVYNGLFNSQDIVLGELTPSYAPLTNAASHDSGMTYRLLILRRAENEELGIRIPPAFGNCTLYVNGIPVAQHTGYEAGYEYFSTGQAPQMELILQVPSSNHIYDAKNSTLELGLSHQIQDRMTRRLTRNLVLIIFLFFTAIIAFALNFMDERSKYYRYLGFSLLFACLASAGTREGVLFAVTPSLPLEFTRKLTEVAVPLSMLFLCQFFFHRFQNPKSERLKRITLLANSVASLLVLILPFVGWSILLSAVLRRIVLLFGSLMCILCAGQAIRDKKDFANAYAFAALLLFFAEAMDTWNLMFSYRDPPFAWYSFAVLSCVPFATFLKEFKDIRSDFGLTHFSLEQQANSAKKELNEIKSEYERQGMTDQLTGISSRAYGEHVLTSRMSEKFGAVQPFSMILLDVDDFTRINNQYGFEEGNRILVNTAHAISKETDESATVCRWGNDEFLLILPDVMAHEIPNVLKKIRLRLDRTDISEREWISYCWSAVSYEDSDTLPTLMKRLSDHLKEAKENGRNSSVTDETNFALQMNLFSE